MRFFTALSIGLMILMLTAWTGCSCEDPESAPAPVVVVPEAKPAAPAEAPERAAPAKPAARAEKPRRRPGGSLLQGPADYLRTTTITVPRYARKTLDQSYLNNEIEQFHALHSRYPKTLKELADWRGVKLQEPPAGYKYQYDPHSGKLEVVPAE